MFVSLDRADGRRPLRPSSARLFVLLLALAGILPARLPDVLALAHAESAAAPVEVLEVLVAEDGWVLHRFRPAHEGWAPPLRAQQTRRVGPRRAYVLRTPGSEDLSGLVGAARALVGSSGVRLQLRGAESISMDRLVVTAEALAGLRIDAPGAHPLAGVWVDARP